MQDPRLSGDVAVSYMLSSWAQMSFELNLTATQNLNAMFGYDARVDREEAHQQRRKYAAVLALYRDTLRRDKELFVDALFPVAEMSCAHALITILVRFQFAVTERQVLRHLRVWESLPELGPYEAEHDLVYGRALLQPARYHDIVDVAADLPNYLATLVYERYMNIYLEEDEEEEDEEKGKEDRDETGTSFYWRSKKVDELIEYMVELASYPVVPLELCGSLVPSTVRDHESKKLALDEISFDNRSLVEKLADPRPCVMCRMEALRTGLIDRKEMVAKIRCECVLKGPTEEEPLLLQGLGPMAASMRSRELSLLNPGCSCAAHASVHAAFAKNFCNVAMFAMSGHQEDVDGSRDQVDEVH